MKCASQINSLMTGNTCSYVPSFKIAAAVATAAKNITGGSTTTPYTLTCSSPLQLTAPSDANTNTIVNNINNIHSIYMVSNI
jgi:hypothetical protein